MLAERADRVKEKQDDNALSAKVMVMDPILRFLQLLCENHNAQLQVSLLYTRGSMHRRCAELWTRCNRL